MDVLIDVGWLSYSPLQQKIPVGESPAFCICSILIIAIIVFFVDIFFNYERQKNNCYVKMSNNGVIALI